MVLALIVATLADIGLAILLVAVSGFILQGVNNQGAMQPEAALLVLMVGFALAAPAVAWVLRSRQSNPKITLAIAYGPLIVAATLLLVEPIFV